MASSFFLIPLETVDLGGGKIVTREKYIPALNPAARGMVPFGSTGICWADLTPAQAASVSANADVVTIPPVDTVISGGALTTIRNQIEALQMPAQWVKNGDTYRATLRMLVGMAQLIQRMTAILGRAVTVAGDMDKQVGQLAADVQLAVPTACDELGIDRSGITSTTSFREVLRIFGEQFVAGKTVNLGDL